MINRSQLWKDYQENCLECQGTGITIDTSRMHVPPGFWQQLAGKESELMDAMAKLEAGSIANPDEDRMVGHYWLRTPEIAPEESLRREIEITREEVITFADMVHAGEVTAPNGKTFKDVLIIGIGGSALGPQLVADALGTAADRMTLHFLDNTDPDGIQRTLSHLTHSGKLATTLAVVISKSGGTPETRNGMVEAEAAWANAGLKFSQHAVAITGRDSKLDKHAETQSFLARFPMWDWVGGRTSVMSAVGLLPMALQGLPVREFLAGAAAMDGITRHKQTAASNPALRLAFAWHTASGGEGRKDMVMLPYKDRLTLFSKYLQQLVMESIGKRHDLDGREVFQGLAVYGNKGSTDQHAYVQQLRDGVDNFFATFIICLQDEAMSDRPTLTPVEVEPGITSGDYLVGFWLGTREALTESGRDNITLLVDRLNAHRLGALIALYERAVGFYATLVHVNAYHQPGVEAGKKAAATILECMTASIKHLQANPEQSFSANALAEAIGQADQAESIYLALLHRVANQQGVTIYNNGFKAL